MFRLSVPEFLIRYLCFGEAKNKKLVISLREAVKENNPDVLAKRAREGTSVDVTDKLSGITMPCLYLCASDDKLVPETAMSYLSSKLPQMAIQKIQGPHFILQTRPKECFEVINRFVKEIENA